MRLLARKHYQIVASMSGFGLDEPGASFYLGTDGRMQGDWLDK